MPEVSCFSSSENGQVPVLRQIRHDRDSEQKTLPVVRRA
jgi:hypothetical protein